MSARKVRLSHLLCDEGPANALVAFGRGGERRRGDLLRDVAALAASVEKSGRGRWLVHTADSYAAAVSLLGLARAGGQAVFAPSPQPEALRPVLAGAELAGALIDPGLDLGELAGLRLLHPLEQPPATPGAAAPLERDAPFVELRTSGTTGPGTRVVKALRQLEDEVATLEALFAARLAEATRIFATASHLHIYGLLFRMLWPLASGRPFHADTPLHPQELLPRMLESGDCLLVTTPAVLKRMNAGDRLRTLRPVCRAIFSSGGPLDADTARGVAAALGAAPYEVFGSTETGGVALRRRDTDGDAWTPLPGVAVDQEPDGRLRVRSAFVSGGEPLASGLRRFSMGDRVELAADGRFRLLGRADRTVKIGEKRVALPEMEQALERHPAVEEAALLVLTQGNEPRVHAVVALSAAGRAQLGRESRRELGAELARSLAGRWDRVLLPRVWRFVEALPRDSQGKLPQPALEALFASPAEPRDPVLLECTRDARGLRQRLRVPPDLVYLEGHFDGLPVVPGVVQLGWALRAGAALLAGPPRLRGLEALKFPSVLRPGDSCELRVELGRRGDRLRFELRAEADGRVFASGRCLLAEPVEAAP